MNNTPHEHFADGGESVAGNGRSRDMYARERETLPPLPDDCLPEPDARTTLRRVDAAGSPRHPRSGSGGAPRIDADETDESDETGRTPQTATKCFARLLRSLVGRSVTIIDPESFEEAAVGHRVRTAIYRAELIGLGDDYAILAGEFVHRSVGAAKSGTKETIRQYIPFSRIKRVSILAREPMLHL